MRLQDIAGRKTKKGIKRLKVGILIGLVLGISNIGTMK
jgi:hypothetical protein